MTSHDRVALVLELLEGKSGAAELAQRHGIAEEELLAWRDTFLAGARTATRAARPRRHLWVAAGVLGAAVLGLASKEALAASCMAPSSFSSLGLNYFCPNDPAIAADVNANTLQLVKLMEQKVGSGWGPADAGAGTTAVTASSVTVNGASTLTGNVSIGGAASESFGSQTRQMLNLWGTNYGIGVQNSTLYFRSASNFSWFVGGSHSNTAFDPGPGGVEAMRLTANGALSVRGLKQVNGAAPVVAPAEVQRLIVDATPAVVGQAVPIDYSSLVAICGDDDGCPFTISMINFDGTGSAATRDGVLFLSQSSNQWRLELNGSDVEQTDSNNSVGEVSAWDCYFGDFNLSTDTNNGRADTNLGFGLLNCKGCNYSDTTVTCRMVFRD